MRDFIHRANIDHYIELLNNPDLATDKRATITKLLVAEEDKISHRQEQLEFAESRAAKGRERLSQPRSMRDDKNSTDRAGADRRLVPRR
jgi:hypothetical protein